MITTYGAYGSLVSALLGRTGAIARLRTQYRLPAESLQCTPDHVHVIAGADGKPIDDIRDEEQSRLAGEFIGEVVRRLAGVDTTELHCSVAGGRKTMSALLATAFQLHGRPQDRLYHVLVDDPFERVPDFFFPPRPHERYRVHGRLVDSRDARVRLVEIPVVKLGAAARLLGVTDLALERTARELQAEMLGRLLPDGLVVTVSRRRVAVGDREIALTPQEIALYGVYALTRASCRTRACRRGGRCPRCCPTDDQIHDRRADIFRLYRQARGGGDDTALGRLLAAGQHDAEQLTAFRAWLQQTRSRINRRFDGAIGRGPVGRRYRITPAGDDGDGRRRRGLAIPPRFVAVNP